LEAKPPDMSALHHLPCRIKCNETHPSIAEYFPDGTDLNFLRGHVLRGKVMNLENVSMCVVDVPEKKDGGEINKEMKVTKVYNKLSYWYDEKCVCVCVCVKRYQKGGLVSNLPSIAITQET
jgi:hypothetical protein